jgi:hypothetical protein
MEARFMHIIHVEKPVEKLVGRPVARDAETATSERATRIIPGVVAAAPQNDAFAAVWRELGRGHPRPLL